MKYLLLTFGLFLAAAPATAQSKTTITTEVETNKKFTFSAIVDDDRIPELIEAFAEITDSDVHPDFRGPWTKETTEGIRMMLNTERGKISIKYRGEDKSVIATAVEKANVVRRILGIDDAPAPPPPPITN
ncbi:hypothetical protein [Lewinella sp. 4G2]|uniref:hypothetical protein n=1 Tax=Lewinella sp. 4G2 TaxID=1803372 RepID=UPI0007B4F563|nr:hypothetical protein [Lewinella sp. 4G2]OAV42669.1 hypothetical protein A3850_015615 [Lewinella sp. 4G2]